MDTRHAVFISYAHHDTTITRVAGFTKFLTDHLPNKIRLFLDRKFLKIGRNIPNYMQYLESCPVVIILLTPEYKRRVENTIGGVFKEFQIIRKRILNEEDDFLCLPLLFEGNEETSIPEPLKDFIYKDLRKFTPQEQKQEQKTGRYTLSKNLQNLFFPVFREIARTIEAKISVRIALPEEKYTEFIQLLFAKTKITRGWIQNHPEFLNHLFVSTKSYKNVESQHAFFLIGRKGSGKSTVANSLPELRYERYKTNIVISADYINLLAASQFIDYSLFYNSTTNKINGFDSMSSSYISRTAKEFTQFYPLELIFKYTWLGLIYICLANALDDLGKNNKLNIKQQKYYPVLSKAFKEFSFGQSGNIEASTYFTTASIAFCEFWENQISKALDGKTFHDVIKYVDSNVNKEQYLKYLLGEKLLDSIRNIVSNCDKYALLVLDDFDTVFSMFRQHIQLKMGDENNSYLKYIESACIHSLMILILELKGCRKGWYDPISKRLDFCITIPKDSYMQVIHKDRDAYLNIEHTTDLDWTGIYLAEMLLKRLSYMYNEPIKENKNVLDELNRLFRTYISKLPTTLEFEFNDQRIHINLFCYVLRHTFWRPRDVLTYYASLLTAATSLSDNDLFTTEQIRMIIGVTTRRIVQTEFIREYKQVIKNLNKILQSLYKAPQIMTYEELYSRLKGVDFHMLPNEWISNFKDKLKILYEIGLLGLQLDPSFAKEQHIQILDSFYFNEGSIIFDRLSQSSFEGNSFIIHPIFVEELSLDYSNNSFVLNLDEDYLMNNHLVRMSSLDIF
ncbi:hypothetical protein JCM12298_26490 [Desulfothermus naphthae]